ncbi:hypothetical protein DSCA_05490 [Desulfosarcina alkanivorans]|uniref:Uncharacterized protein n=1 Tax=Desulfosarcina alkanivorans TaxID=571177 RepID=A0A5K7YFS5_9BACT|nr:hypothetical protein [Desulfosarcina alkanivorans]BBO66619.1 hypothetical protein DSCA_05490 [Desulfosarcina alkanivorans]
MDKSEVLETFKMSSSMRGLIIVGLLLFGIGLVASIVIPIFDKRIFNILWIWIPIIIGYVFFLKLFITAWKQRNNYIATNNDGISLCSPESQLEFIRWSDIDRFKENNIFERLTVIDRFEKHINVEYELENLNKFLSILIANIAHLKEKYSSLKIFHRTIHHHTFYIAFTLFLIPFIVYSIYSGLYLPFIFFTGLFVFFVYLALAEFIKIEIKDDRILIVYPIWKKIINISDLERVTIENFRVGGGKASQCVFLKVSDGKKIKLNSIKEGTIPLYLSINREVVQGIS